MLYPLVIMTGYFKIFSTLWAVIVIHTIFGMPILTLLFRNFFVSLPPELFKAARVDGAGFWRIFFQMHDADVGADHHRGASSCRSRASGTTSCSAWSSPAATTCR